MSFAQPFSNYEILERLGAGAMGTVFKARQRHMNRIVAIKVLKPSLARDERYVDRLRREARIVGQLNHPHIVTGYDLGEEGGYHFFVMEYIEGKSLRDLLTEWGHFNEEQVLDVAVQVTDALAHAYDCGVIHRDVKPANILIDAENVVKLTDMGLAKGLSDFTLTRDGATVGTPQYISPEQARNPQEVDVRSDLYSLGASLFHMATGQVPFKADTIGELIHKVLHERPPAVETLNPAISDGLSLVIRKLLAKDPGLRYQTPQELLDDLERVQRQERPSVDPRSLDSQPVRDADDGDVRRRWWLVGGSVAALAVVVALVLSGPGMDPGGSTSDESEYATQLVAELTELSSPSARIARIDERLGRERDPARQRLLRSERSRVLLAVRSEVESLFDDYESAGRAGLNEWATQPDNWRDTLDLLSDRVDSELRRATGFVLADLPDARVLAEAERRFEELAAAVRRLCRARDVAHFEGFATYLETEVRAQVRGKLDSFDFAGARRATSVQDSFHGVEGRPSLAQLPDDLKTRIDKARESMTRRLEEDISRVQANEANALGKHAQFRLARANVTLQDIVKRRGNPDIIRDHLDSIERDLARKYPTAEAFGDVGENPWGDIEKRLAVLRDDIEVLQRVFDGDVLDNVLNLCWRVFVDEGAAPALRVLEMDRLWHQAVEERRRRHLEALNEADGYASRLMGDLLKGKNQRTVALARPGRAPQDYVIRRDEQGVWSVGLMAGSIEVPLRMSDIDWSLLESKASLEFRQGLTDLASREGRAVWLLLRGSVSDALDRLDGPRRRFLQEQVVSRIETAIARPLDDLRRSFDTMVVAQSDGDVAIVRSELAGLQARVDKELLPAQYRQLHEDLVSWVDAQDQQGRLLREYRARSPRGSKIAVAANGTVSIDFELIGPDLKLPSAWSTSDHIHLARAPADVAESWNQRLEIDSPMKAGADVRMQFELRLPELDERPRVVAVELHGIAVVLVVLPNGRVAIGQLDSIADTRTPAAVASAMGPRLEPALSSDRRIVSGAWHNVTLEIRRRRGSTLYTGAIDGRPFDGVVRGDAEQAPSRLTFLANERFGLRNLRLQTRQAR